MGSLAISGITGEGHESLGTTAPAVTDIYVQTVTIGPRVMQRGSADPVGLVHFGIIALGCFPDDSFGCVPALSYAEYAINATAVDIPTPSFGQTIVAPSVFWRLNPGCSANITVFW